MKKTIKDSFQLLVANRYLLVLSVVLLILTISFALYVSLTVKPSELQLVSHCSAFGLTHLYRDQWFYLLTFGFFGFAAAILHIILATKLLSVKGSSLAIMFVWLGIVIVILAWMTAYPILNIFNFDDCRVTTLR